MLIHERRLAQAVDILGAKHAHEATVLTRAMLETWVNARWIRIKEPRRRAKRFMQFDVVEQIRVMESTPVCDRPVGWQTVLRDWKKARRRVRHLFWEQGWTKTWAVTGSGARRRQMESLKSRTDEVITDMQRRSVTNTSKQVPLYLLYRVLSQTPHGTQGGMSALTEKRRKDLIPAREPEKRPLFPMLCASMFLLSFLQWATQDLTQAYDKETADLVRAHERLIAAGIGLKS